jgi:hypothetical protein
LRSVVHVHLRGERDGALLVVILTDTAGACAPPGDQQDAREQGAVLP